ncbi:hypothetical protein [Deefgea sp. CFH1-16]|nr:hypothetical protein [Deefgea sp. CFH1-16]
MSVDRHLIEETLSSQPLFKGKLLNAFCDTVRFCPMAAPQRANILSTRAR